MGTWGGESFQNDTALDYVAGLKRADQLAQSLSIPRGKIAATHAEIVLAAAEVVAAMKGSAAPNAPADVVRLAKKFGPADSMLIEQAKNAVSAVIAGSELVDLWASSNPATFNASLTGLIARLNPDTPFPPKEKAPEDDFERTCMFCDKPVKRADLFSVTLKDETGPKSDLRMISFCHLACFNGVLPTTEMIQDWEVDEEFIQREMAKRDARLEREEKRDKRRG